MSERIRDTLLLRRDLATHLRAAVSTGTSCRYRSCRYRPSGSWCR